MRRFDTEWAEGGGGVLRTDARALLEFWLIDNPR